MSVDIENQLRTRYGTEVCATRIAENVSLAESPASNQDVFEHAPDSRGARNYTDLLEELIAVDFIRLPSNAVQSAVRIPPQGARTALTRQRDTGAQQQVAASLRLIQGRRTGG
jgi:hypothetical protein